MTVEQYRESAAELGAVWVNATGDVSDAQIAPYLDRATREIANWVKSVQAQKPSIFNRAAYVAPDSPYAQMQIAKTAVENDDIVGGVCDVTEGLMLQGIKWESENADEADVFNQIARDINLDEFCRMWHREEYTYSQVVVGVWWGRKEYKIRGKTEAGNKKKRSVTLAVPVALTFLDPTRVVPLKPGPFGQDRLAWQATENEFVLATTSADALYQNDAVLAEFTNGPVRIDKDEQTYLEGIGVKTKRLLALNPRSVFRGARTKMSYERWPALRLKSTFALLDLKQQLIESDRVSLVGSANFILLVRQGSDTQPALPEEITNLQDNFKVVAKLPVVIGDHRLSIDIITPDQEFTLAADKYDTLDRRILSRCLGALTIASSGQRNESTLTVARGIARLLETRRHMMKRTLERELARAVVDHPSNKDWFETEPNLTFTPRNVQLDQDSQTVQAIMALRTQNEISRESTLEFFGFDQAVEALRREFEEESGLDDIFQTRIPFSASGQGGDPNGDQDGNQDSQGEPEAPQVSGARGGRPKGGGRSKQSPQRQVKPQTKSGNPST